MDRGPGGISLAENVTSGSEPDAHAPYRRPEPAGATAGEISFTHVRRPSIARDEPGGREPLLGGGRDVAVGLREWLGRRVVYMGKEHPDRVGLRGHVVGVGTEQNRLAVEMSVPGGRPSTISVPPEDLEKTLGLSLL